LCEGRGSWDGEVAAYSPKPATTEIRREETREKASGIDGGKKGG
jgi:hypothetical protein